MMAAFAAAGGGIGASVASSSGSPISFEIFGKVQGVFFRKHTQAKGTELKLRGWCENTKAGTVRGEASGAPDAIKQFKRWLEKTGSPKSRIERAVVGISSKEPSELPHPFAIVK